ncbi:disulfide bond formation protein B [Sphingomonas sp. TREG-RG-20F-R18-01]|uniref:disulfide bond formation protein B n=1 Tax=Sphingomonas sp. TREG-RG-20F-R18-01 TaxID=2914982 RepID=UPI001F591E7F|nr:disulfide bond formation protein B [Sphingomonas sp. TREG-RG-20F-R18-01]
MTRDRFPTARLLALLVPVALLGGALVSQYVGKLYPCELCWFQRYPHAAAIVLAALAFVAPGRTAQRLLVALAGVAILVSGLIGVFHAGVEYHWWQGFTECTSTMTGPVTLDSIMKAPIVRCDVAQWRLGGISLAGFNAVFSIAGAIAIFWTMRGKRS